MVVDSNYRYRSLERLGTPVIVRNYKNTNETNTDKYGDPQGITLDEEINTYAIVEQGMRPEQIKGDVGQGNETEYQRLIYLADDLPIQEAGPEDEDQVIGTEIEVPQENRTYIVYSTQHDMSGLIYTMCNER